MLWSELLPLEAFLQAVLSGTNCAYLSDYYRRAFPPARRAGALVLALLNGALALEAIFFIFVALGGATDSLPGSGAAFVVRSLLLASTAFVSLAVWRGRRR